MRLEQSAREVHRDGRSGAAEAGEVVHDDVVAHLVLVDDHGSERGRRVEDGAVDDQHVDLVGTHVVPLQQLVHAVEHDQLGLVARGGDGEVGRVHGDAGREVRLVSDARAAEVR